MQIPQYWARERQSVTDFQGKRLDLSCWRWSDNSLREAQQRARAAMVDLVRRVQSGQRLDRYAYGDRPLREEIVQRLADATSDEAAIVTRNAYGALILNCARVMFADIDFPRRTFVQRLWARLRRRPEPEAVALLPIRRWVEQDAGRAVRVYRTYGGLRCLMTGSLYEPTGATAQTVLTELASDPLYRRLCRNQASFRARLTPKPWRCGLRPPPARYPWEDEAERRRQQEWLERYERARAGFGVCRLVAVLGTAPVHPAAAQIQAIHDSYTLAPADRPLA